MPRGDRTGRSGMGLMTGRGLGFCAGHDVPGYANTGFGRGHGVGLGRGVGHRLGMGFGLGRGFGRGIGRGMAYRYGAGPNPITPMASHKATSVDVKRDIEVLEKELSVLRDQLASLTKEQES